MAFSGACGSLLLLLSESPSERIPSEDISEDISEEVTKGIYALGAVAVAAQTAPLLETTDHSGFGLGLHSFFVRAWKAAMARANPTLALLALGGVSRRADNTPVALGAEGIG